MLEKVRILRDQISDVNAQIMALGYGIDVGEGCDQCMQSLFECKDELQKQLKDEVAASVQVIRAELPRAMKSPGSGR